jgi:biotin-[acetyl-CoA-carboxylase] ligase BirA-like protein
LTSDIETAGSLPFVEGFFHFDSIDSTNTFAKSLPSYPKNGMAVVCADKQTAGRGQRQNTFFSEVAGGLYASVVCPISDLASHFTYNRAVSLAIYDAVKALAPKSPLSIKWPNDIYWGDRKLCGILLETVPAHPGVIVIGFGINVNIARLDFPPDIRGSATSVLIETRKRHAPGGLLCVILERFRQYLSVPAEAAHMLYANRLYKMGAPCAAGGNRGTFAGVYPDGRMRLQQGESELLLTTGPVRFAKAGKRLSPRP